MTALKEFERLECMGVWLPAAGQQRRDVIVSFGEATLVLTDSKGMALTHWSLPAVQRRNPGETPALFGPDEASEESLEISDETMVSAITRIQDTMRKRRARPGRLRKALTLLAAAGIAALAVFWLPDAMISYTAKVVPPLQRASIGDAILGNLHRIAGRRCATSMGRTALDDAHRRLLPGAAGRIEVVAAGVASSEHLPGGIILLNRSIVEDHESPDVMAGYVIAEAVRARLEDPLVRMLKAEGLMTTFRLLTTGRVPTAALESYAEKLLTSPRRSIPDGDLLQAFKQAHVSSSPYAYAIDMTGETTVGLIEADPFPNGAGTPVLSDFEWVALQGICGE